MKKLGLGTQEFLNFKKENLIYVDKTEVIHKLIDEGRYYFLSRPRRFGKSLLVNTLEAIFEGNKPLFEDTWIYDKWDFEDQYTVIKIPFASLDYEGLGVEKALNNFLDELELEYTFKNDKKSLKDRFKQIIKTIGKEKPVVILVDEYDKPIIDYLENKTLDKAYENRAVLKNFYSSIKDCDKYIKMLFITGVSKFSKVSFFSELNNLTDITIDDNFSQIVGWTEQEIIDNFSEYLTATEKKLNVTRAKLLKTMKLWYDGYSWDSENFVYNPYSVLTLLQKKKFSNYWFNTGTPTFLTKQIRENKIDVKELEDSLERIEGSFDSYDLDNIDIYTLLFQAGYLTLKEKTVNPEDLEITYKISYPNKEVKDSFYDYLIHEFTNEPRSAFLTKTIELKKALENNDVDRFFLILKAIYSNIPHTIFLKENEYYYHTVIYIILKLMNAEIIDAEKQTNHGRIDAVIFTKQKIFIMEFKMSTVNAALKQIKEKKYYEPYLDDERDLFCIGVAFGEEERNIKEYKIQTIKELLDTNE